MMILYYLINPLISTLTELFHEIKYYLSLFENMHSSDYVITQYNICLLYTSPSPRDRTRSRMPSSA